MNGEIFTKSDLEQHQVSALRQKGQQIDLKADSANQQLRKALDEITPQIMVDAVDEMLLVQRGKELGYKLSDEQFKGVLDNIKKENKLESEEQFQAALKAEGITMVDLRRNLERSMLVQRVQQNEVMGKIGVSDDEARKYYDSHLKILVAVPSDGKTINVGKDDDAKAKAEQIRVRAVGGESFEKLAADVSDSPSRSNAGLIGPISLNDLSADLRKMVEVLKAGDVTPVTRMARGYQLYKLEALTTAQTMPFEQARDQIGDRVFTDKRKAEYQKYLEKLRAQAIIEWKNPDVKKAFEAGLKAQATVPSP